MHSKCKLVDQATKIRLKPVLIHTRDLLLETAIDVANLVIALMSVQNEDW